MALIMISYKIQRKKGNKLFNSLKFKYTISKFSWRLLIGQNYSLNVLLLDEIYSQFKKGRIDLAHTFGALMYINCNAQSKLFADYRNLSLTALDVESLKPCYSCPMKSFNTLNIYFYILSSSLTFWFEKILHVFLKEWIFFSY